MVFHYFSVQKSRNWSCNPKGLLLNPFNVLQFLDIFVSYVIIRFYDFIDQFSQFLLNSRILLDQVEHCMDQARCCVSTSNEKVGHCLVKFSISHLFIGLLALEHQSFKDVRRIFYSGCLHFFSDDFLSFGNKRKADTSIQINLITNFFDNFVHLEAIGILPKEHDWNSCSSLSNILQQLRHKNGKPLVIYLLLRIVYT